MDYSGSVALEESNFKSTEYSRLVAWEVFNFMSIESGRCDFDDRNIINLKGYNDSGKSAMLNALRVLLFNANPTKQVSFIQDDKDYFRVVAYFDDGVQILRDKYINGQSLYEMYKDNQCIFSTKKGNALTKVSEVPQPIADYLGLITADGVCLNARACFEKQIGVQTTGSENYKLFNSVLKSEEIASAGAMLNNDKNKLASDISVLDYELQAKKKDLEEYAGLSENMVLYLKEHDISLDTLESNHEALQSIRGTSEALSGVVVPPEVGAIDETQLSLLEGIENLATSLSGVVVPPEIGAIDETQLSLLEGIESLASSLSEIVAPPEVAEIDTNRLETLSGILSACESLKGIAVPPEVAEVNVDRLETLEVIRGILQQFTENEASIAETESRLSAITAELADLQKTLEGMGVQMARCPQCGTIFNTKEVTA